MKMIIYNGFYFSGKFKDLLKELNNLSKKYKTLCELCKMNRQ
ncbi:MAG: hypothetical protein H6Q72_108 [Firmicutes bacterium]|nr:hypothetical protein [Bacillota bacterium]